MDKRDRATWTPHRTFRLPQETLNDLDLVAQQQREETGERCSRSQAIRVLARREARKIRRKMAGGT